MTRPLVPRWLRVTAGKHSLARGIQVTAGLDDDVGKLTDSKKKTLDRGDRAYLVRSKLPRPVCPSRLSFKECRPRFQGPSSGALRIDLLSPGLIGCHFRVSGGENQLTADGGVGAGIGLSACPLSVKPSQLDMARGGSLLRLQCPKSDATRSSRIRCAAVSLISWFCVT